MIEKIKELIYIEQVFTLEQTQFLAMELIFLNMKCKLNKFLNE